MTELKKAEPQYAAEAVTLALTEYRKECEQCPALMKEDFKDALQDMIHNAFEQKYGQVALEDGKLIGYLAFFGPFDGFFGNVKGAFSPLGCSAFAGEQRGRLASQLFEKVATLLVEDQVFCYGCSRYAHDEEVGKSFVMNGFGIRCSDSILRLKERKITDEPNPEYTYCELTAKEKELILPLRYKLTMHLAAAPTLFPTHWGQYEEWFSKEEIRVFVAKDQDKIIGFMAFQDEAETFVSERKAMMNICGAYVEEEYRSKKVAPSLLEHLCRACEAEGNEYLGVDCETLNPNALRFWGKYFQNYTYSYARRADERMPEFMAYMNQMRDAN